MAKSRKSIVAGSFAPKERPTAEEARKAAEKIKQETEDDSDGRKMGRPHKTHGLKRTSIQADPKLMRRMKVLASLRGEYIYETLNSAMEEYLERHE